MTNTVSFPGLGLSFELSRVVFPDLSVKIYWYGVIIALGFLLAVFYCYYNAYRFGVDRESIFDLLILAVPLAILGARAYYVIFYLDLFRNADGSIAWGEVVAIWDGGMAIYGAIIMAIVSVVIFCRIRKISALTFLDLGSFGVLIGQIAGRWGNFVNVEAYGGITGLPWRMSSPAITSDLIRDGYLEPSGAVYEAVVSGELGVHPTFLYESLWNLAGFCLMVYLARRWRRVDGQFFLTYLIWYGVGRFFIEGLRTDSLYLFDTGIRVSQLLGLLSALAAAVWLFRRLTSGETATAPLPKRGRALIETEEESGDGGDQT